MRRPRKRQTGTVWLRGSSSSLRFYGEEGKRRAVFLHEKDGAHYSATCPAVKQLAAEKEDGEGQPAEHNARGRSGDGVPWSCAETALRKASIRWTNSHQLVCPNRPSKTARSMSELADEMTWKGLAAGGGRWARSRRPLLHGRSS